MTVQNVAIFNQKSINPAECIETLIDLTYLINQGHVFSSNEQENIFFSVTKLLNSQNEPLKRVVFLFLAHWAIDPNTGFIFAAKNGSGSDDDPLNICITSINWLTWLKK